MTELVFNNGKKFSNKAFQQAIVARGFSVTLFAKQSGLTITDIIGLQQKDTPTPNQIRSISDILKLPVEYFYTEPVEDFKSGPKFICGKHGCKVIQ